jgi:Ca2+-binding RTX toxin-like protein
MRRLGLVLLLAAFLTPVGADAAETPNTADCGWGTYTPGGNHYLIPNDDTVYDAQGRAVFNGTNGDDMVWVDETAGIETVVNLKRGDDYFCGGPMRDIVNGGAGVDNLWGNGGKDKLKGKGGDDHIFGSAGDDKLWGNGGDDSISGGLGADVIKGGGGDDALFGGDSCDTLGDGDDVIKGGKGDDFLCGASGADRLIAGPGDDTINSGNPVTPGNDLSDHDVVKADPGYDTCDALIDPNSDTRSGCDLLL